MRYEILYNCDKFPKNNIEEQNSFDALLNDIEEEQNFGVYDEARDNFLFILSEKQKKEKLSLPDVNEHLVSLLRYKGSLIEGLSSRRKNLMVRQIKNLIEENIVNLKIKLTDAHKIFENLNRVKWSFPDIQTLIQVTSIDSTFDELTDFLDFVHRYNISNKHITKILLAHNASNRLSMTSLKNEVIRFLINEILGKIHSRCGNNKLNLIEYRLNKLTETCIKLMGENWSFENIYSILNEKQNKADESTLDNLI